MEVEKNNKEFESAEKAVSDNENKSSFFLSMTEEERKNYEENTSEIKKEREWYKNSNVVSDSRKKFILKVMFLFSHLFSCFLLMIVANILTFVSYGWIAPYQIFVTMGYFYAVPISLMLFCAIIYITAVVKHKNYLIKVFRMLLIFSGIAVIIYESIFAILFRGVSWWSTHVILFLSIDIFFIIDSTKKIRKLEKQLKIKERLSHERRKNSYQ